MVEHSQSHQASSFDRQGHKSLKSYIIGFLGCVALTGAAFGLAAYPIIIHRMHLLIVLMLLAVLQLLVQVTCFLRLNNSPEGRWNLMPFLFTLLIVSVLVGGSLWIMINLNQRMM